MRLPVCLCVAGLLCGTAFADPVQTYLVIFTGLPYEGLDDNSFNIVLQDNQVGIVDASTFLCDPTSLCNGSPTITPNGDGESDTVISFAVNSLAGYLGDTNGFYFGVALDGSQDPGVISAGWSSDSGFDAVPLPNLSCVSSSTSGSEQYVFDYSQVGSDFSPTVEAPYGTGELLECPYQGDETSYLQNNSGATIPVYELGTTWGSTQLPLAATPSEFQAPIFPGLNSNLGGIPPIRWRRPYRYRRGDRQ